MTRRVVEFVGHDPDTYYMIGVEHRIPEPTPEARAKCVEQLLEAGFSQEAVGNRVDNAGRAARRPSSAQADTLSRGGQRANGASGFGTTTPYVKGPVRGPNTRSWGTPCCTVANDSTAITTSAC